MLTSTLATAAAHRFYENELAPDELRTTMEAFTQIMPLYTDGLMQERFRVATEEVMELTATVLDQPNNPVLVEWIRDFTELIRAEEDFELFLRHLRSASLQYDLVIRIRNEQASNEQGTL